MATLQFITQWATILSPIIAVIIAIGTYRDNQKSLRRQVNIMKILCRQQINVQITMLEIELWKRCIEKCEHDDEIFMLSKSISELSQQEEPPKAKIDELRLQMRSLSKQSNFKDNWKWQIIFTQFRLLAQSHAVESC